MRMLKPMRLGKQRPVAALPPKKADPFYATTGWKEFRLETLERNGYRCAVPGCERRASFVDHPRARRWGGADFPKDARCLCDAHDGQLKERPDGSRAEMPKG